MFNETICSDSLVDEAAGDDLSREVYCILGMPIDVIDMASVLRRIDFSATSKSTLFVSTPNLNYLVHCHLDLEFRDSMLLSDLSPADGMPIVWLGRLWAFPSRSELPARTFSPPLKVYARRNNR